jgi:Putative sensor
MLDGMAESLSFAIAGRGRPGVGSVIRAGRRTLVESLYLLTAPVTAVVGLLLVIGGVCVGTIGSLVPGGSVVAAGALTTARWPGDVEWWRVGKVRTRAAGQRTRPKGAAAASDPGLWLDLAHAVVVVPIVAVTSVVTGLWWFVGLAVLTFPLRTQVTPGTLRPMTLYAGSARSHVALSLGLTSPDQRITFAITLGVVAKHSHASRCTISLCQVEGVLRIQVTDDGVGGAALAKGHGLQGLDDRVRALGGELRVTSPEGGPTTIEVQLPCR